MDSNFLALERPHDHNGRVVVGTAVVKTVLIMRSRWQVAGEVERGNEGWVDVGGLVS